MTAARHMLISPPAAMASAAERRLRHSRHFL